MNVCTPVAAGLAGALVGTLLALAPGPGSPAGPGPLVVGAAIAAGPRTVQEPCPCPTPTPTPTPPPVGGCPIGLGDVDTFRVQVKAHGGKQLDTTVYACGPRVRAALENCGTSCCPLDANKGAANGACGVTLYGPGGYTWEELDVLVRENPWTVKIREGDGTLHVAPKVAAAADVAGALRSLHAFAMVPACDVDGAGVCQ